MGKPFKDELKRIPETFKWVNNLETTLLSESISNTLNLPLFIVGSGGSLSACYFIANLQKEAGGFSEAITPLQINSLKKVLIKSNLLFISSSGKNNDILFGYKTAVQCEPNTILSICMTKNSPLASLSNKNTMSNIFEFDIPTGKDGFLATNSLISYFLLSYKAYGYKLTDKIINEKRLKEFDDQSLRFIKKISVNHTINILYGNWGLPVAIDLESKLTEAALCNSNLSDYRNFGHGRHHWFAKKIQNSALIALITPEDKQIAEKTIQLLPKDIPILIIESEYNDPYASIDLLIKAFFLIKNIGDLFGIDPGRPGVPEFGRKLYNLKYANLYKEKVEKDLTRKAIIAIRRKKGIYDINTLNNNELEFWKEKYRNFISNINSTKFGILIFDYDDTLCSSKNRFNGPSEEIISELNRILSKGFIIGIVTGRGKSVRHDLQNKIDPKFWTNIIIGYYNGSQIGELSNNSLPNKNVDLHPSLKKLKKTIDKYSHSLGINIEIRPTQLTISVNSKKEWSTTKRKILEQIYISDIHDLLTLESGHSIDIIPNYISKLSIIDHCKKLASQKQLVDNHICIGDKGRWPGNDFKLLNTPNSLSVNETSTNPENCWNLSEIGLKNTDATLFYLKRIKFNVNSMCFKF